MSHQLIAFLAPFVVLGISWLLAKVSNYNKMSNK